jgi:UDP-N-acetylmuramoylalanine--D-glutamate ligase
MIRVAGKRVLVLGAGRSGRSAAELLADHGAIVDVLDKSPDAKPSPQWPPTIQLQRGDDRYERLGEVVLVVSSPGVPRNHPLLIAASARQIPIWSEIELASRFLSHPILAVTGTNGKSTTTTLLGNILAAQGGSVFVGGNLGTPLSDAARDPEAYDSAVVEVSSFQLEWVESFRPHVAVLLNLTPDHQDRYSNPTEYGAAKARLLAFQEPEDFAVLNRDDPWVWEQRHHTRASVVSFGRDPVEFGTFLDGEEVVVWASGQRRHYALAQSPLRGEHNRENIQAAVTAAAAFGLSDEAIRDGLAQTQPLPHRLELVREHASVRYYDDSKATNVGAVEKSICSFPGDIVLLLGGYDKGGDFTALRTLIRERVVQTVCFGAAGSDIAAQLGPSISCTIVPTLAAAVATTARFAKPGAVVLLAPGCASFDEFTDYTERGRRFRTEVEKL